MNKFFKLILLAMLADVGAERLRGGKARALLSSQGDPNASARIPFFVLGGAAVVLLFCCVIRCCCNELRGPAASRDEAGAYLPTAEYIPPIPPALIVHPPAPPAVYVRDPADIPDAEVAHGGCGNA